MRYSLDISPNPFGELWSALLFPFSEGNLDLFFNIFTFHLLICEGHSNNNFCFIPGFVPELYFFLVDAMHFPFCNLVNSSSSSCPWSSTIITNYPMSMDNWGGCRMDISGLDLVWTSPGVPIPSPTAGLTEPHGLFTHYVVRWSLGTQPIGMKTNPNPP